LKIVLRIWELCGASVRDIAQSHGGRLRAACVRDETAATRQLLNRALLSEGDEVFLIDPGDGTKVAVMLEETQDADGKEAASIRTFSPTHILISKSGFPKYGVLPRHA
jgi:hypothetical protein